MRSSKRSILNFITYFSAIHAAIYFPLAHQCSSRQLKEPPGARIGPSESGGRPASIKGLLALKSFATNYNLFFMFTYFFYVLRSLASRLLATNWLLDYQLLDCFIMGRIPTVGRLNLMGPAAVTIFAIIFFVYRRRLFHSLSGEFKFQVFEFMLHDYHEVLCNEISAHRTGSLLFVLDQTSARYTGPSQMLRSSTTRPADTSNGYSSLFYLRNELPSAGTEFGQLRTSDTEGVPGESCEWILRLNRTSASWCIMVKLTLIWLVMSLFTFIMCLVYIFVTTSASLVTPMGFEINYPTCARWLQRRQQQEALSLPANASTDSVAYANIHLALNKRLACDRPIAESPVVLLFSDDPQMLTWTPHTIVRLVADIIQTYLFYIDFTFNLCTQSFTLFILSLDVILNARKIRVLLLHLIRQLRATRHYNYIHGNHSQYKRPSKDQHWVEADTLLPAKAKKNAEMPQRWTGALQEDHFSPRQSRTNREQAHLCAQIIAVQSIIADHFNLVKNYNCYVSFYLLYLLLNYLALSAVFTILIFVLKSGAIEQEFLICELTAIIFILYLLAGPCLAHLHNARLHSLISSAMALDCTNSLTKFRWIVLMKYYQPNPLYCFTLLERIPVSWLSSLKLISWFFSAIFVLENFLYMYRDPITATATAATP